MQKTKITFENEDGSKRAVMNIEVKEDKMSLKLDFYPEVSAKENELLYADMAMVLLGTLSKEADEIELKQP